MKQTPIHAYQLKFGLYLLTSVTMPDGTEASIVFDGGFTQPYRHSGTFSTDNPDLIAAIEKDPRFGSEWKRTAPTYKNDRIAEEVKEVVAPEPEKTPAETPDGNTKAVLGITSGQKARAYLLGAYDDIKSSDLRTNDAIKLVAEKRTSVSLIG